MAKDFKMPSKKTIIAIVTIVILAIAATVGTVVFLKGRGESEAAGIETEQFANNQEETNKQQNRNITQTQETEQTIENQGEVTENVTTNEEEAVENNTANEGENVENTTTQNTETTETAGTVATTTTTNTTNTTEATTGTVGNAEEQIQEVEITDTEVITIPERKISEGHLVGWEEIQPVATFVDAIDGEADETDVTKSSETTIGKNVTVSEGIITYHVTVKNTTERKLSNIEIKDEIPAKTTYVQNSADNNAQEIKDGEIVKALKWFVDIEANGEKTVSFKVQVNEGETGTVINQATANGDVSNKEYTAIIEKKKTAVIKREIDGIEQIVPEPAQIGDTITFAITVENTGDIAGNTTIKDEQLEEILKDQKAEQIGNLEFYYGDSTTPLKTLVSIKEALEENAPDAEKEVLTAQDLINGIEGVKIPQGPNQTVSIAITVKIQKVDGNKIVNRATIGEKEEVPTNPVEIETIDLSLTKNIEKITKINEDGTTTEVEPENKDFSKELVKVGDTITYKIVAGNNGSATLNNVKVLDDKTVTVISAELPERLQEQINKEALEAGTIQEGENAQLTTIGKTIESVDYANANKDEVRDNLLGRNDLTLEPGEQVTFIVTYTMEEKDITLSKFINNAKLVGYYKDVPYEKIDDEPIETLDTELTKTIEKITKINEDGTTTEVAPTNKDFSKELVEVGDTITYKIVAKNNSSVILENVKILDDRDVKVLEVTLPTRLEGTEITTTGNIIVSDYENTDKEDVSGNLLGRSDLTLEPGEEIIIEVSYEVKAGDFEGTNYGKTLINNAKFIGYYEGTPYEETDDESIETLDLSLTKNIIAINGADPSKDGVMPSVIKLNDIGDKITYEIIAKNNGSVELENVKILDDRDVKVLKVTLPTRLEGTEITTIGNTIISDYTNKNKNDISGNLLGRSDLTLKPGEEIKIQVTYTLQKEDMLEEGGIFRNNAKFIGYYKDVPHERDDFADVEVEYIPEKGNIVFEKSWVDQGYLEHRPTTITVELQMYKDGKWVAVTTAQKSDVSDVNIDLTVNKGENEKTTYKWVGLDIDSKETGEPIKYRVVETHIDGVAVENSKYTQQASAEYITLGANADTTIGITNSYKEPKGSILRHYTAKSADLRKAPLDVVFVVDTSNSMNWNSRKTNMTNAVDVTINEILGYNEYNRVSIVGFSGDRNSTENNAEVLLDLDNYKNVDVSTSSDEMIISATKTNMTTVRDSREFAGGTFTQLGIRLGAEELISGITDSNGKIDNTKRKVEIEGKAVTRIPVMILISDGVPTLYTTDYMNVSTATRQGDTIRESAEEGYYTILSAKYYKDRVTTMYGTNAKVLTIGMGISETNTSSTQYGVTVLNPSAENIAKCNDPYEKYLIVDSNGYYSYAAANNLYKCMSTGTYNALVYSNWYKQEEKTIPLDDRKGLSYDYSYADKAYNDNDISSSNTSSYADLMKEWMEDFVTELLPKEFSRDITAEERAQGKVYLDDINTQGTFKLTINKVDYDYANSSAYLGTETTDGKTRMYVDLSTIPADATINIEYTTGATITSN